MRHELRNPLGVIKNSIYFLNMKMNTFKDEAIKENLEILQEIETAILEKAGLNKSDNKAEEEN